MKTIYETKRSKYVWASVRVKYCHDQGEWIVYGHFPKDQDKRPEVLVTARLKSDAIGDAQLLAFSKDAGPQRAEHVYTYSKRGQLLDAFYVDNNGSMRK